MEKKKSSTRSPENNPSSKGRKSSSSLRSFARYSGIGFQMVIIILLFYWAGSRLDLRAANEKPVYTAIMTVLGVFAGLYIVLKDFIRSSDD